MKCKPVRFAKNRKGETIYIDDARITTSYICPLCNHEVRVRKKQDGQIFYHYAFRPKSGHDFSEHLHLQEQIYEYGKRTAIDIVKEQYYSPTHRADIIVRWQNQRNCIEIQRTKISLTDILLRDKACTEQQMKLVWLLPQANISCTKPIFNFHNWQLDLLANQSQVFLFCQRTKRIFFVKTAIQVKNSKTLCILQYVNMKQLLLQKNLQIGKIYQQMITKCFTYYHQQWLNNYQRQISRQNLLTQLLYRYQINIRKLPKEIYNQNFSIIMGKENIYWLQTIIFILKTYAKIKLVAVIDLFTQKKYPTLSKSSKNALNQYWMFLDNIDKKEL